MEWFTFLVLLLFLVCVFGVIEEAARTEERDAHIEREVRRLLDWSNNTPALTLAQLTDAIPPYDGRRVTHQQVDRTIQRLMAERRVSRYFLDRERHFYATPLSSG